MFARPAGTNIVELTLNKTNIAEHHSYPPFQLVSRGYVGFAVYTSTITIAWVPLNQEFSIIDEPSYAGNRYSTPDSLLLGSDAILTFETLNLLMTISMYHEKSRFFPACIGKRLQDYERCVIALGQTKAQLADARLERHPHDLRFIFHPSNRIIYENAQYLRSTFNEAQKRVVADEETSSDSTMPLASEPTSITCHVSIHTIAIEEARRDTYASYNIVLDWVHCQQVTFESVEISLAEIQARPLKAPLEKILVDELDETSERESVPPTTPTIPSAEGVDRLCDPLGLSELQNLAFDAFKGDMKSSQAPYLLFSTFSCDFEKDADFCIEYCATHWSEVDESPEIEYIRSLIEQDELAIGAAEGARLLSRLFVRVMRRGGGSLRGH